MKTFVVGLINFFDNDNKLYRVEADNDVEAMKQVVYLACTEEEEKRFTEEDLKSMNTVDDIKEYCMNCDMNITTPLVIKM